MTRCRVLDAWVVVMVVGWLAIGGWRVVVCPGCMSDGEPVKKGELTGGRADDEDKKKYLQGKLTAIEAVWPVVR